MHGPQLFRYSRGVDLVVKYEAGGEAFVIRVAVTLDDPTLDANEVGNAMLMRAEEVGDEIRGGATLEGLGFKRQEMPVGGPLPWELFPSLETVHEWCERDRPKRWGPGVL